MRIFVLGTGAAGALLAQLLARQGHRVTCGDRDPERARRFLGSKSLLPIVTVNARNLRGIVRAARGCHLLVNCAPAVFNEIALRAALRLRAHYLDLSAHMTRNPFRVEQFAYNKRFVEKRRAAVITAGVSPGLSNVLAARSAETLAQVEAVRIRLYEGAKSADPISLWSAEGTYDEAVSRPRIVRDGRFLFAKRFSEREMFRFPAPIGEVATVLVAQDEVGTLPHRIPLREMDVKIGGPEMDRLRRWYRQGKLSRSRGLVASRFPNTPTPRQVARLIRKGALQNARFAVAVVVRGARGNERGWRRGNERIESPGGTRRDGTRANERIKLFDEFHDGDRVEIRSDATFPTLYQIRLRGLSVTPVAFATAHMAALFVRHFPRDSAGVFPPCALPADIRRAILADARRAGFRIATRTRQLKREDHEDDW